MNQESYPTYQPPAVSRQRFLVQTYGVMALGLLITFFTARWIARFHPQIVYQPFALILLLLAEVIVVFSFTRRLMHASYGSVVAMFVGYSALNGVTMSVIFLTFQISAIYLAFGAAAVAFIVMALYGHLTKRDLSPLRGILLGGLIALLVLTLLGIFLHAPRLELLVCCIGVIVFLGLTAYDAQKLLQLYAAMPNMGKKLAVYGALQLYLDFVNLFQYILLFAGNRRRK